MRDHNPEEATSDFSELRTLLVDMQTATQTSIQQLSEMLATHLDALTTALAPRLDPQAEHGVQAPLPPAQRRFPPLQHPQQHLPPPQPQHQRHLPAPFQHQRQQNQHRRYNPRGDDIPQLVHSDDEDELHRQVYFEDLQRRDNYDHRGENSFKVDIPEFHDGLRGDDLIDWLISVEEILEFKQVPPTRRVSLVAMRFRGHAATWWKQIKTTRSHTGKSPIQSWEKLTKHLRQTFLPHNYERTMYTRLQNLRQGNRTVDKYAEEFALLLTRNKINDSQVQLVSHFIGGL